jgi:hypothetical protein
VLIVLNMKCRITINIKIIIRFKDNYIFNLQKRRRGLVQRLILVAGASEVDQVSKEIQARQMMNNRVPKMNKVRK